MRFVSLFLGVLTLASAENYVHQWRAVADRLIQTPPESYPFNWGEGVQQIGLMKVYERTHDPKYADYMERWTALYTTKNLRDLLDTQPKPRTGRPGYCGYWSPATAIAYLNKVRPKPEYQSLVEGIRNFVRPGGGAERSPTGALGHWIGSHQLWVDTLYMACPLLAASGKPSDASDAAHQILEYAKPLQDDKTGLFYHMWDWQTTQRSPSLWGRGNGWVLMSIADTMEALPKSDPQYAKLKKVAARMLAGLTKTQDQDGMWHTILDDKASYPEASATSMVAYGLLKLSRLGVLTKKEAIPPALRAWTAVNQYYVKDGVVTGVSAGTDPGKADKYKQIRQGSQTWGTGAYLMVGSEVDGLR
ncbi:MAG: glycoside hydrolase family 88 protein [Bryobacterales bacterium]|nr:glycoside hydrolase family 88 protein [Bryobacterales bacterium]